MSVDLLFEPSRNAKADTSDERCEEIANHFKHQTDDTSSNGVNKVAGRTGFDNVRDNVECHAKQEGNPIAHAVVGVIVMLHARICNIAKRRFSICCNSFRFFSDFDKD